MILAVATVVIYADNDAAVDEVYRAIHPFDAGYPGRVVTIRETKRELVVDE